MLRGKGLWAYREGELDRALECAPQMGATHILYKVGQGSVYRKGMAQIAQRIASAGLIPLGWTWLLLDDPEGEAQVVIQALQDGFQGLVFDTESERCRNRPARAVRLGQALRSADVDLTRLYNCSFPNISHHTDLPYEQMNEFCKGGLMPMAYGTFFSPGSSVPPEEQARRVIDEWTYGHYAYWSRRWGYSPPLYPVLGPYHDEAGEVRMTPAEFKIWLDRLAAYGPSFFSVFTAAVLSDDLLPLIRACPLGEGNVPAPARVWVEVCSPQTGFLNVRPTPSTVQPPVERVAHGTILEALEAESEVRKKVGKQGEWLRISTPDGRTGYVAAWYLRLPREEAETPLKVRVHSPQLGYLNVRPSPSLSRPPIVRVEDREILESLEPAETTLAKLGQMGQWLRVRTADGIEGYVAAWHLISA